MQFGEHAVLATHVVSGFDFAAEGRTAQDDFPGTEMKQVGEVGMAAGKLLDGKRPGAFGKMIAQESFEARQIQLFSGPDSSGTVAKIGHVRRVFSLSDR